MAQVQVKAVEIKKGILVIPITRKIYRLGNYQGKDWYNLYLANNLEKDVIRGIFSDPFNYGHENPLKGKRQIVIVKDELFGKREVHESEICSLAKEKQLIEPHPKVAFITRSILSNKDIDDLGLGWLTCMHKPIEIESENGLYGGRFSVDIDTFVSVKYNKNFRTGHAFVFVK